MMKIFNRQWWQGQFKYYPWAQKLFLLCHASKKFPATLNIEPTNLCNLACRFCPTRKTDRKKDFMKMALYRKIIKALEKEKKLEVLWLNKDGEPLLHPNIGQMAKLAAQKKVAKRLELYTNGVNLNQKVSKALIKAGLDSLVVSLDAASKQSFKKLKGKDKYDLVVDNINKFLKLRNQLKKRKPVLTVKMVCLAKKEAKKFRKIWRGKADQVVIQKLHDWESSEDLEVEKPVSRNHRSQKRYPCSLPWSSPAVNWDGTVTACCINYKQNELIMGDLNKNSLKAIWQGEKFNRLRQAHLDLDFKDFPTCAKCQFWHQRPNIGFWLRGLRWRKRS